MKSYDLDPWTTCDEFRIITVTKQRLPFSAAHTKCFFQPKEALPSTSENWSARGRHHPTTQHQEQLRVSANARSPQRRMNQRSPRVSVRPQILGGRHEIDIPGPPSRPSLASQQSPRHEKDLPSYQLSSHSWV